MPAAASRVEQLHGAVLERHALGEAQRAEPVPFRRRRRRSRRWRPRARRSAGRGCGRRCPRGSRRRRGRRARPRLAQASTPGRRCRAIRCRRGCRRGRRRPRRRDAGMGALLGWGSRRPYAAGAAAESRAAQRRRRRRRKPSGAGPRSSSRRALDAARWSSAPGAGVEPGGGARDARRSASAAGARGRAAPRRTWAMTTSRHLPRAFDQAPRAGRRGEAAARPQAVGVGGEREAVAVGAPGAPRGAGRGCAGRRDRRRGPAASVRGGRVGSTTQSSPSRSRSCRTGRPGRAAAGRSRPGSSVRKIEAPRSSQSRSAGAGRSRRWRRRSGRRRARPPAAAPRGPGGHVDVVARARPARRRGTAPPRRASAGPRPGCRRGGGAAWARWASATTSSAASRRRPARSSSAAAPRVSPTGASARGEEAGVDRRGEGRERGVGAGGEVAAGRRAGRPGARATRCARDPPARPPVAARGRGR